MGLRQARSRVTGARRRAAALLAAVVLLTAAPAGAAPPIGVVTELHLQNGQVEVKPSGGGQWEPAKPLLSISEGDQLRASGAGRAVLIFAASQRSAIVTSANSPFVAAAPAQPGLGERIKAAVGFLQATPREPRVGLSTRSPRDFSPVVLLAPRETLVAADAIGLEWAGPEAERYTVRVLTGDGGVLWEKKNVEARMLAPAASELRLVPGRYRWQVDSDAHGIHHVTFDVATPEAVAQATAAVAAVDAAGYPAVTAALLRAAALMREGFRADARRELLQTIAANPEEPTLHVLLADVYSKTRLDNLAAAEGQRAMDLSGAR
jgi:hypothetical protein